MSIEFFFNVSKASSSSLGMQIVATFVEFLGESIFVMLTFMASVWANRSFKTLLTYTVLPDVFWRIAWLSLCIP